MPLRKSIYLSDEVLSKLSSIAIKKSLLDESENPDFLSTVRYIINEFTLDDTIKQSNKNEKVIENIERLVEQIHVIIPHILYNTRYASSYCNTALTNSKLSDDVMSKFRDRVMDNVYQTCGYFQEYNYNNLYLSSDEKNMKTIPIEEDKNTWK